MQHMQPRNVTDVYNFTMESMTADDVSQPKEGQRTDLIPSKMFSSDKNEPAANIAPSSSDPPTSQSLFTDVQPEPEI